MKPLRKYIYAFIFCGLSLVSFGQGISPQLDSIHNLEVEDLKKLTLYDSLLKKHEDTKDYAQLGSDAHQIAKWLHKKPKTKEEAIIYVKKAIDARTKADSFDPDLLKRSYNNLGLYYFRDKKYRESIKVYKKLVNLTETDYLIGRGYSKIGDCYRFLQDPYLAIDNYNKAFSYLKKSKKNTFLISNHIRIASAFKKIRSQKNTDQALNHLKKAETLLLKSQKPNKQKLYTVYNNTGNWYYEIIHDTLSSHKYYKKALEEANKLEVKEYIATTSYNLGLSYIHQDNNIAKQYFEQSLENYDGSLKVLSSIHYGIGLLENSNHSHEKATINYFKSLSILFNREIDIDNILIALNQKNLVYIKDKTFLLEVLKSASDNYIDQGIFEKNIKYYKKAIALVKISDKIVDYILRENISDNTKFLWRSIVSGTYASGIEASFKAREIDYGFYLSEKNKALLLMQEISKEKISIPTSILKEESKLRMSIINLEESYNTKSGKAKDSIFNLLFTQKQSLKSLKDSIALLYPDYNKTLQKSKIIPLSEITYNDNQIIIQYMMTERVSGLFPNTYCLVLSKNHKQLYQLENTKKLHEKIYDLRKQLDVPFKNETDIDLYKEKSYQLYTSLIPKEVKAALKNKKVTIIPDHLINTIPFEALVTDIDSGRYLLEDCEISYTYSLSFEKQNEARVRNAQNEFLGIAPVNFTDNLTSLPQSKKEISTAHSYYTGSLLMDKQATKENFIQQASDYKIIHLATHANASDSIAPWIAFRNQKMIDKELDLLNNQADLVVLSACNTSLGFVNSGEGVLSLARGFFKSGAKSVIPSLWSTNDKATATITSDFYKNLSEGQTKSAALRTAKLNYLHNNTDAEASPHYWASLVLIGDSGTLLPQSNNLLFLWVGLVVVILMLGIFIFRKRTKN
ncbi:CHAT domain-containing tetratricopeptide repeat protein [uncultured Aquimarina sp.]|uniref:CHAT domain-containing protein n=1 Tax=uncultured Aquimarina sp. TaxID=575652 RepID=UPI00260C9451|nr:CHAT domain-containing tetratricopeptide repeat protein [uncultured Aquimarina sp.]